MNQGITVTRHRARRKATSNHRRGFSSAFNSFIGTYNTLETITESCDWKAPISGWYKFQIKGAGGGGQGNGYYNNDYIGGSGGGEGGLTIAYIKIKANDIVNIYIGLGGNGGRKGGTDGYAGSGGQDTVVTFDSLQYIGGGGYGGTNGGGLGGRGTIPGASGGSRKIQGQPPNIHVSRGANGGGQGGGSADCDGVLGGGGGGGSYDGEIAGKGGNGGNGVVWIEYYKR